MCTNLYSQVFLYFIVITTNSTSPKPKVLSRGSKKLKAGYIVGIVVGVAILIALIIGIIYLVQRAYKRRNAAPDHELLVHMEEFVI